MPHDPTARFLWNKQPPTDGAILRAYILLIAGLDQVLDFQQLRTLENRMQQLLVESMSKVAESGLALCNDYECAHALIRAWIDMQIAEKGRAEKGRGKGAD